MQVLDAILCLKAIAHLMKEEYPAVPVTVL
jgi:hypothetical protein